MPTFRIAALAACAGLLAALPSQAANSPVLFCYGVPFLIPSVMADVAVNPSYARNCAGPMAGSITGADAEAAVTTWAKSTPGLSFTSDQFFQWVGKSDDKDNGPFASAPAGTSGVLTFREAQKGLFVIALQGGFQSNYDYYLFDGGPQGGAGVSSLNFDTNGLYDSISFNPNGSIREYLGVGPSLARAGLYVLVPEPASTALMLAGLAGIGWAARRRGR